MTTFNLLDLGEGLPEADIVAWHVKEGDRVEVDQPMVSVETAKAVVEVPSPYTGVVTKLYARVGDTVQTGRALVEFEGVCAKETQPAATHSSSSHGQGMVVGHMASSNEEFVERAIIGSGGIVPKRMTVPSSSGASATNIL